MTSSSWQMAGISSSIIRQLNTQASLLLGLCYYEPQGDAPTGNLLTVVRDDGFVMPFKAHLKEIELDPEEMVRPLLKEVREMVDRDVVPEGNRDCKDCRQLDKILELIAEK